MFGDFAPVWPFLSRFGGPADPTAPVGPTLVFETYPVLAIIALGWTLLDSRSAGRLPKYNPSRKETFSLSDWQHVCSKACAEFRNRCLSHLAHWLEAAAANSAPRKSDQDRLDALLCLLVAINVAEGYSCLMIGDTQSGYIVVPHNEQLKAELEARCVQTGRPPGQWLHIFQSTNCIAGTEVKKPMKPYHEMTVAERTIARIAKNREGERARRLHTGRWTLSEIVSRLDAGKQRATYGAVAGLVGGLARGLMNGRPKTPKCSWVVASSGPQRGWPTGYTLHQIHPDCFRQTRAGSGNVINDSAQLERWLEGHTGQSAGYY